MSDLSQRVADLSPNKRELFSRLMQSRNGQADPLAIIGIGCRVPGASGPNAFWRLLQDGTDAISEVPADRWEMDAFYDPDPGKPGGMVTRWGGFLEQVDQFDYRFFGISPREASRMDPQQRLLLETAWEALEDAGQAPEHLAGGKTGVFIGISTNDYSQIQLSDLRLIDAHFGTGNALCIAANRLSYFFDLRGPSMAIDTACSSSLVAVHLACRSIWSGESQMALAGGVNLILSPVWAINFTKAGAMAVDGRCKAFDARADGYVRGEGVGIIVIKPLSKALSNGDPIYALIRGSAVNQDGRTNGLMAPNSHAQEAVLLEAYRQAGVSPGEVQYIEAHGTGTLLGDPIEAKALGTALSINRPPGSRCRIGSVKTNIGHLESAAGITGLIKVALSLKNGAIPPSLHFREPNPHIPFTDLPLQVQQTLSPWPQGSQPAIAGVSAFSFGGTNAHVVLEGPPKTIGEQRGEKLAATDQVYLLPLSARSHEALYSLVEAYRTFLKDRRDRSASFLRDLCFSAALRRSHHDHRLAFVVRDEEETLGNVEAILQEQPPPGVSSGRTSLWRQSKLVYVFSGQGSQWCGMGRELFRQEVVFRESLENCDRILRQFLDWSLLEELAAEPENSRIDQTDVLQPAIFAVQVSLAALWKSWGIEPDLVIGQSMREVTAAYIAGILSLEDAARVICCRSRLMKRMDGQGAVALIELSFEETQKVLQKYTDRLAIAGSNSPKSTILSGDAVAMSEVLNDLRCRNVFCQLVKMDVASHSPQMEPLRQELLQSLSGLEWRNSSIPICSTVTGEISNDLDWDERYWWRNLRDPMRFFDGVRRIFENGYHLFLEISPHPVLTSSIRETLSHFGYKGVALSSLHRHQPERAALLRSLGALYMQGRAVNWKQLFPFGGACLQIPTYPWRRERCWLEVDDLAGFDRGVEKQGRQTGQQSHPLGRQVELADHTLDYVWESEFSERLFPYARDHQIQGAIVAPGTIYMEMALAAAGSLPRQASYRIIGLEFQKMLILSEGKAQQLQTLLSSSGQETMRFRIYSRQNEKDEQPYQWTLHASGEICHDRGDTQSQGLKNLSLEEVRARCVEEISGQEFYAGLRNKGLEYGPSFQGIQRIWRGDGEGLGEIRVPDCLASNLSDYCLHPAVLDTCLQVLGGSLPNGIANNWINSPYLPIRIKEVRVHGDLGAKLWSHVRRREYPGQGAEILEGDILLTDETGRVLVEILGFCLRSLEASLRDTSENHPLDWLYEIQWEKKARQISGERPGEGPKGIWIIFADSSGIGDALRSLLEESGAHCLSVITAKDYEVMAQAGVCRVNPSLPEHFHRLLNDAQAYYRSQLLGIVYLWALNLQEQEGSTELSFEELELITCESLLHLVRALATTEWNLPSSLWLVTRNAQPVDESGNHLSVNQAPLWGFGRVIALEHRELWGGLIDLGSDQSTVEAASLFEEISHKSPDQQIAIRDGQRYLPRLVRSRRSKAPVNHFKLRTDAAYLITGGLSGLGLEVARWMVEQGARRLILLGRTEIPRRSSWSHLAGENPEADRVGAIRELESMGASIHVGSVDVADQKQLSAFLERYREESWPPICGVVHAAGVIQDQLLIRTDSKALRSVLRPKIQGAWLLHQLLEKDSLDFFVMFSSASALFGQYGQASYAAGNCFMDALAHYRRSLKLPAISINWGPWAEVGIFARLGLDKQLDDRGIRSLSISAGRKILEHLFEKNPIQVAAIAVDRQKPVSADSPLSSLLLGPEERSFASADTNSTNQGMIEELILMAEPAERRAFIESRLRELVAQSLRLSPAQIDVERPLTSLGLDSIMAVEIRNRVEATMGLSISLVDLLKGTSIVEFADQLKDQIPEGERAAELLEEIEKLSMGEVQALLANETLTSNRRRAS